MKAYLVGLFSLLVFLGTAQESQDGYIIDLKRDTIRGRVVQLSKGEWFRKCLFIDQNGNEAKYFSKDKTILGFGFARMHFLLNQKTELFMQTLIKGEISLYHQGDVYYIDQDSQLYEVKPDKKDVYVNGARYKNDEKRWKGVLSQLASTCEQAKTAANSMSELSKKGISSYIIQLNDCRNSSYELLGTYSQKPSQDGYILDMQNDTIRGKIIQLPSTEWARKCYFINDKGQEIRYVAEDQSIRGFGFGQTHYLLNSTTELFMRSIIRGETSLYSQGDAHYVTQGDQFFEIKPEKEVVYIDGIRYEEDKKRWKGTLTVLAAECENARQIVEKMNQPSRKNVRSFVIELNECGNKGYIYYAAEKRSSFDVSLGFHMSMFTYDAFPSSEYESNPSISNQSIRPSIGTGFNLKVPFLKKESFLRLGVVFSSYNASSTHFGERSDTIAGVIVRDVFGASGVLLEGSIISFPISLDYPIMERRDSRISVSVGVTQTFLGNNSTYSRNFNESANPISSIQIPSTGESTDGWITGYNWFRTGYVFGLAFERPFNEMQLGLKLNYFDFGRFSSEDLKHHGFNFGLFTRF